MKVISPKKMAAYREAKNMSQTELAKLTGVNPSMVCHIELGSKRPTVNVAANIADALGVTVDDLLAEVR